MFINSACAGAGAEFAKVVDICLKRPCLNRKVDRLLNQFFFKRMHFGNDIGMIFVALHEKKCQYTQNSKHSYTSVPVRRMALMCPIIWTRDCSLATRWVPRSGPLACHPNLIQSLHGMTQMGHDSMSTLRPCCPTLSLQDGRRCDGFCTVSTR